jgi:hypothetical protein
MNFASENVRKKAEKLLLRLETDLRDAGFFPEWMQGSWRLDKEGSPWRIDCGYEIGNKFLTKVYCLYFRLTLDECEFADDFEARCEFLGGINIKDVIFRRRKGSSPEIEALCDDRALADSICGAAGKFDIETIYVRCNRALGTLSIEIKPYAGAFVWVKFPPLTKQIPLRSDETAALCDLANFMEKHFSEYERSTAVTEP